MHGFILANEGTNVGTSTVQQGNLAPYAEKMIVPTMKVGTATNAYIVKAKRAERTQKRSRERPVSTTPEGVVRAG